MTSNSSDGGLQRNVLSEKNAKEKESVSRLYYVPCREMIISLSRSCFRTICLRRTISDQLMQTGLGVTCQNESENEKFVCKNSERELAAHLIY